MPVDLSSEVRGLHHALVGAVERLAAADAQGALDAAVAARRLAGAVLVAEQAALLRLQQTHPDPTVGPPLTEAQRVSDVTAEIAAAYGMSWGAARGRLAAAAELAALPALRDALLAGEVDLWLVRLLLDRTRALTPEDRERVVAAMLAEHRASDGGLTAGQWSRLLGRTVLSVDPTAGRRRAAYARVDRQAWHTAVDDATGLIGLRGPIADTLRAFAEVDAAARALAADPDETRTLSQLRFDLACDRLLDLPVEIVDLPRAADTTTGTGDRTGGAGEEPEPTDSDEPPTADRPHERDGHHQPARSAARGGDTVVVGGRVCTVLNVTVPLSTLLGLDDAPGEVAGSGPIGADAARAFAAAAPIWRRLLTDPVDGHLVIQDVQTYRPSDAQRRFVLARHDWASAARGGDTTRTGLQLDHDVPYAAGGATSVLNLPPLDERSHDRKTKKRWRHRYDGQTGTLTQTTTLGRTYRTTPLPPVGPTGTRADPEPDLDWDLPPLREPPAWLDDLDPDPWDDETA